MMGDGLHYCLDSCTAAPLTDTAIRHYLEVIPGRIGMTVIHGPQLVATPTGWQGFVIIAESHISVETRGLAVFVDIFSCKPFDQQEALAVTRDLLGLDEYRTYGQAISRGWQNRG